MILTNFYAHLALLVTGGCGFIGSQLVKQLVDLGAHVTVIDNLSTGSLDNIRDVRDKVNFIQADITDFNACLAATANQTIVFHCAAFTSVNDSMSNPLSCHTINTIGTLNVLEAARQNHVKRFVFSSSAAVYGACQTTCDEHTPCAPTSPYGWSKFLGELYCKQYSTIYQLETIVLRYFNVYTTNTRPMNNPTIFAQLNNRMKNNLPITIFGDGTQTRDFVLVDEVARANTLAGAMSTEHKHEVFNIATGISQSILELITNLRTTYPDFNQPLQFMPARTGDIHDSKADCSKYHQMRAQYFAQ